MTNETAEERFARRTRGAAYRRLKGEMKHGDPLTLPTTKEQLDELERSRMDYQRNRSLQPQAQKGSDRE